jgi:hypothetical protein
MVDSGLGARVSEQQAHDLQVAFQGCFYQRSRAPVRGDCGVGPPLQQQLHHGGASPRTRMPQGGTPMLRPLVHGHLLIQQPPYQIPVPLGRGDHQRRPSCGISVRGMEQARVLPHQPLYLTHVAFSDSSLEYPPVGIPHGECPCTPTATVKPPLSLSCAYTIKSHEALHQPDIDPVHSPTIRRNGTTIWISESREACRCRPWSQPLIRAVPRLWSPPRSKIAARSRPRKQGLPLSRMRSEPEVQRPSEASDEWRDAWESYVRVID